MACIPPLEGYYKDRAGHFAICQEAEELYVPRRKNLYLSVQPGSLIP